MKRLELNWTNCKWREKCMDFFISGRSLFKEIERRGIDKVPRSAFDTVPIDLQFREELLLLIPSEMPSGQVPLYVCHMCGDFGCGVVSVRITRDSSDFVWSNFA